MNENIGIGSRIQHSKYGKGVVINVRSDAFQVTFIDSGYKEIPVGEEITVLDDMAPDTDMVSLYEVEKTLKKVLQRWSGISETVSLGDKWKGGKMILQPGNTGLTAKEISIDQFFYKIVMVRDRVRVMEQRINSSNLDNEEKVNLQQYITRIYGSLTTFNVLFKLKEDQFVGEKGSGD
ncbi:hypothetical protein [Hufsiella ginkgonis]|uniref:Uncharacterized protein n=1 Tax=Hufsiella ginkgonis TaxID=2695274 RepID=A0A7K1XWM3_9SPHI|nr:hypothetical protein [Hufsiella ginkgonis]MXV15404.1 hypothetical protein [Hufsiella ginkgonis]